MGPVVGIRYKCAVCPDYDLCENCEAVTTHDHPFLKIRNKKQTPYRIIAIVEDEQSSVDINGQNLNLKEGLECVKGFIEGFNQSQVNEEAKVEKSPRKKKIFKKNQQKKVEEVEIPQKRGRSSNSRKRG